eukprot:8063893-Karenia_brevis.AAC.1
MIQEVTDEWQLPLWACTLDFKKAFDSISHEALWCSLTEQGVGGAYINALTKLYKRQTGAVKTDVTSRYFNIERGVRQRDPLSSLLFNSVSESILRRVKQKWSAKGYGLHVSAHGQTALTNLRFADD